MKSVLKVVSSHPGNYLDYKTSNVYSFLLLNRVGELRTIFKRIISFHRNNFYFNDIFIYNDIFIWVYKRSKISKYSTNVFFSAIKLVTVSFETFYKSSTSYRRLCERVKGLERMNRFLHSCSTRIPDFFSQNSSKFPSSIFLP